MPFRTNGSFSLMQNACIIGAAGVSGAAEVDCEELESGASSICGAINACACPPECDTEAAALGLCEFNKGLDTPCSALNCPERTTDAAGETTDAGDAETTMAGDVETTEAPPTGPVAPTPTEAPPTSMAASSYSKVWMVGFGYVMALLWN